MSTVSSPTLLDAPNIHSETPDALLLTEFVSHQDEAAFAALVQRHSGLVRGVCRRILLDPAAADDAFQQTFLSLAQHARVLSRSVNPEASLGSWLYRVAVNASLQIKRKARSRRRRETTFAAHRPASDSPQEPWNDVYPVLDEEISALPGQHRLAVVKCHLEGKTQQDAAKELGITYATLRRRLKEARGMLRQRLSQRGFVQNGFLLVPLLNHWGTPGSASAASTTQTVVSSSVSTSATATTAGGALSWTGKLLAAHSVMKSLVAGVLVCGLLGGWLMIKPKSAPETASVNSLAADGTASENDSSADNQPQATQQSNDDFLELHFGYVLRNGHPVSPELENAVSALSNSETRREKPAQQDNLDLPPLGGAREMRRAVELSAPLPEDGDLLSQSDKAIAENLNDLYRSDPNAPLLMPTPKTESDPLPVEQVMKFLNEEQDRRSRLAYQQSIPATAQFFGHPSSKPAQPAKTLKVLPLP